MPRAILLTTASAALYAGTFPPWSLWWLAWVALAPWLVACAQVSPRRAALLGIVWGIIASYGIGWWFPEMLTEYFELSPSVGWLGFFGAATLGGGVYFAALGAWIAWMARRRRLTPVVIAAAWATSDLLRARLVGANPWGLSPYSQAPALAVIQIADLGGPFLLSALLGWSNGLFAALVEPTMRGRSLRSSSLAFGTTVAVTLLYGLRCVATDYTPGPLVSIAVIQGAMERGHSWRSEYWTQGLERYLELTEKVLPARPELIVWPENAINFYVQEPSREQARLFAALQRFGANILFGGPRYAFAIDGTHYYNSAFLFRDGEIVDRYDKRRLLPIAETPVLGFGDSRVRYRPGITTAPLPSSHGPIGAFICVEGVYPEYVQKLVAAGAELLVEVSNDAWFRHHAPAQHHLDMTAFRAVENRRVLVRAASTGISAIIDAHGRTRAAVPLNEQGTLIDTVRRGTGVTIYQRIGDAIAFVLAGGVVLASVGGRRG